MGYHCGSCHHFRRRSQAARSLDAQLTHQNTLPLAFCETRGIFTIHLDHPDAHGPGNSRGNISPAGAPPRPRAGRGRTET